VVETSLIFYDFFKLADYCACTIYILFFKLFVSCFYYMHKTSVLDAMCKRFFVVCKNS